MVKTKFISLIAFCSILVTSSLAQNFSLLPVTVDGKVGYIDNTGTIVIEPKFDFGNYFHQNGRALVRTGDQEQVIDALGNYLCEPYEELGFYPRSNDSESPQWISAKKDGEWGYLDENFEEVIPFIYDAAEQFKDGIAIVKKKKKFGYYTIDGEYHKLGKYEDIKSLGEGLFILERKEEQGIYNIKKEQHILDFGNYSISEITGKKMRVINDDSNVPFVIDIHGKIIFEGQRDWFISLSSAQCDVITIFDLATDTYGIMSLNGDWIQQPTLEFESMYGFTKSGDECIETFRVENELGESSYGAVNSAGKIIIEPSYQSLYCLGDYFLFQNNGKVTEGLMDRDQNIIVPDIYNEIEFITDKVVEFSKRELSDNDLKKGYLNVKTNQVIWSPSR